MMCCDCTDQLKPLLLELPIYFISQHRFAGKLANVEWDTHLSVLWPSFAAAYAHILEVSYFDCGFRRGPFANLLGVYTIGQYKL